MKAIAERSLRVLEMSCCYIGQTPHFWDRERWGRTVAMMNEKKDKLLTKAEEQLPKLTSLRELKLRDCNIGWHALKLIASMNNLTSLTIHPIHQFNEEGLPFIWQMTGLQ